MLLEQSSPSARVDAIEALNLRLRMSLASQRIHSLLDFPLNAQTKLAKRPSAEHHVIASKASVIIIIILLSRFSTTPKGQKAAFAKRKSTRGPSRNRPEEPFKSLGLMVGG